MQRSGYLLTLEEIANVREIFNSLDRDGDGIISTVDFQSLDDSSSMLEIEDDQLTYEKFLLLVQLLRDLKMAENRDDEPPGQPQAMDHRRIQQLEEAFAAVEDELQQKKNELREVKAELLKKNKECEKLRPFSSQVEVLKSEVTKFQGEVVKKTTEMNQLKTKHKEEVQTLEKEIKKARIEKEEPKVIIRQPDEETLIRLKDAIEKEEVLERKVEEQTEEIKALKLELQVKEKLMIEERTLSSSRVEELTQQLEILEQTSAKPDTFSKEAISDEVRKAFHQSPTLTHDSDLIKTTLAKENNELKARRDELIKESAAKQQMIDNLRFEMKKQSEKFEQEKEISSKVVEESKKLKIEVLKLQNEKENLSNTKQTTEREVIEVQRKLEVNEKILEEKENEISALEKKLEISAIELAKVNRLLEQSKLNSQELALKKSLDGTPESERKQTNVSTQAINQEGSSKIDYEKAKKLGADVIALQRKLQTLEGLKYRLHQQRNVVSMFQSVQKHNMAHLKHWEEELRSMSEQLQQFYAFQQQKSSSPWNLISLLVLSAIGLLLVLIFSDSLISSQQPSTCYAFVPVPCASNLPS